MIENRPGAGGAVAVTALTRLPADGYNLVATTSTTIALDPQMTALGYSLADFTYIAATAISRGLRRAPETAGKRLPTHSRNQGHGRHVDLLVDDLARPHDDQPCLARRSAFPGPGPDRAARKS